MKEQWSNVREDDKKETNDEYLLLIKLQLLRLNCRDADVSKEIKYVEPWLLPKFELDITVLSKLDIILNELWFDDKFILDISILFESISVSNFESKLLFAKH